MVGRTAKWRSRGASEGAPLLHVEVADTFLRRFLGLIGRKAIAPSHALLIVPCSGVQMCFMRFAIDVVFLKRREGGESWQVIKVAHKLQPWFGISICMDADAVLEMSWGEAKRLGMEAGMIWEEMQHSK